MTKSTTIGVVGAGVMGQQHARAISEHPVLTLAGVADINDAIAHKVAEETGSTAFTSYETLYEEPLDAVVVATPEMAHRDPVVSAARYGYDILLEKPVAQDRENAEAIALAVNEAGISILIGFTLRFDAKYGTLISKAHQGELGEIASIRAERSVVKSEAHRMSRSDPLLYQTIHDMDMTRWLTGSEVDEVYSVGAQRVFEGEEYDVTFSTLSFADGTVASIETASILPEMSPAPNRARFAVKGTEGTAELATPGNGLELCTDQPRFADTTIFPEVNGRITGAIREEIDHFSRVVRDVEQPVSTLDDGLRAGAIARACREALHRDQPVKVEPFTVGEEQ